MSTRIKVSAEVRISGGANAAMSDECLFVGGQEEAARRHDAQLQRLRQCLP